MKFRWNEYLNIIKKNLFRNIPKRKAVCFSYSMLTIFLAFIFYFCVCARVCMYAREREREIERIHP